MADSSKPSSKKTSKSPRSTGASSKKGDSAPLSVPPSSRQVAGRENNTGYLIGMLVFGVGGAFLLYRGCNKDETTPKPTPVANTAPTETAPPELPEFSPPPPPDEEEDAGVDAGDPKKVVAASGSGKGKPSGGGACGGCGKGQSSGALNSAVSGTAGLARGCYQRALRTGGAEGRIMVSVSVGADGRLCSARIASDSVGNPAISSCVLSKFQSRSYPKPKQGCVVINVPIAFKMKTQ
jgi:TonB family protein